ncbi:uncharacterized protein LOC112094601 [Morus notabilis]|uniref:uncharacterized protein LOC112094601 n=1 Tax=Morus notabilis TaxID=981085 RepID=UPI000CED6E9A|nr:uncharacterized protein LOC112094601 [Morus notabilis]
MSESTNTSVNQSKTIEIDSSRPHVPTHDSHFIQITTIRLNGENFLRWSQSVRMYIRRRGKIGYLTGEKKEPTQEDPSHPTWDAENSMVMTWLVNSMEEEISSNYMCYHTAKKLWDNINQIYSDLRNQSPVYELTLKLREICQGEGSVTKYFNSLRPLWQDLDLFSDYEWKSPKDCNHYKKIVEDNRIFKFLIGLNVEFDKVRGRIIGRQPLTSLGEVFSKVRREESHRLVMLGKKIPGQNVENSAFATAKAHASHFNPQKSEEKPRVWCDHCNKPRHMHEMCWKLHGKPANWKGKHEGRFNFSPAAHEATAIPFSKEHVDQILKMLKSNSRLSATPSASLAQSGRESERNSGKTIGSAKVIDGFYYLEDGYSKNKKAQGLSSISSIPVKDQIML